jgi:hypothetical protein
MRNRSTAVDMSSEALDRRLRSLAGIYKLGISLKGAKWVGKVEDLKAKKSQKKVEN